MSLFHKKRPKKTWILRDLLHASEFDLSDVCHVALLNKIVDAYARALEKRKDGKYSDCQYAPASELPYPKDDIRKALEAHLDFSEGLRPSPHMPAGLRDPSIAEKVAECLIYLDDFLDVPTSELPTHWLENGFFGQEYLRSKSIEKAKEAAAFARQVIAEVEFDED